jgi:hypothetical protein
MLRLLAVALGSWWTGLDGGQSHGTRHGPGRDESPSRLSPAAGRQQTARRVGHDDGVLGEQEALLVQVLQMLDGRYQGASWRGRGCAGGMAYVRGAAH